MDDPRDPRHDAATGDPTGDPRRAADPAADPAAGTAPDTGTRDDGPAAAEDAAVARVRAADPAADAAPDLPRLTARLSDATGVPLAAGSGTPATGSDELAAARDRRRRPARWLQVAAVGTGALLLGGGGYALGATASDDPAAPAIALQQADALTEAGTPAVGTATDARSMIAPGFGGRTTFSGEGLPTEAGEARAWAYDATAVATADAARRVAEAFGVSGEPRAEWGQWVVGPNDGTAPTVTVSGDGLGNVWFHDPTRDPGMCGAAPDAGTSDGTTSDGSAAVGTPEPAVEPGLAPSVPAPAAPEAAAPEPADPSVCDAGSTPTGDAAVAAARALVERVGVDVSGYELTVLEDSGLPGLVQVQAAQVVDGTQTGAAWSVGLVGDGVQSASGPLASLVELGTYDVVSAAEAVDRLNDPRFGASFGGVMPLARAAGAEDLAAESAVGIMPVEPERTEPTVPPVPAPGSPIAWPVQRVTLVDARLGVTLLTAPDGAAVLVPAWELTDADDQTWSVVAVAEEQLDLSPVG